MVTRLEEHEVGALKAAIDDALVAMEPFRRQHATRSMLAAAEARALSVMLDVGRREGYDWRCIGFKMVEQPPAHEFLGPFGRFDLCPFATESDIERGMALLEAVALLAAKVY
jgi:hypothetical protein